ncbi:ATP-binding protein [Streptomyces sp. NPDC048436]|uniref:ATP-binding protein n=1 Tax=Streptomyces sp. NPDC048436 TaxID=3365550 RepID=UPI0037197E58
MNAGKTTVQAQAGYAHHGNAPVDARDLRTTVALEGDGPCIARARHLAADFLAGVQAELGLPVYRRALDVTQLVVSELVTNACKYAPGPILMELGISDALVEVNIWDSNPALPLARPANADRIGRHGLEIVTALARSVEARREPVGKRIIVGIALTDDAHDDPDAADAPGALITPDDPDGAAPA